MLTRFLRTTIECCSQIHLVDGAIALRPHARTTTTLSGHAQLAGLARARTELTAPRADRAFDRGDAERVIGIN